MNADSSVATPALIDRSAPPLHAATAAATGVRPGSTEFRPIGIALFLAGFATFSLLYCVQPLLPLSPFERARFVGRLVLAKRPVAVCRGIRFRDAGRVRDAHAVHRPRAIAQAARASTRTLNARRSTDKEPST
jgi:hypothetical protein